MKTPVRPDQRDHKRGGEGPASSAALPPDADLQASPDADPSPTRASAGTPESPAAPSPRNLPAKKGISRTALNFWVDFGMLMLLCNTMWIAGVVFFVFPAPSEAAGWNVFGYGFDQWSFALLLSFSAFCLGVLVHLILHWTWILGVITSRLSKWKGERVTLNESVKTLYGVGSMIVVLTLLAILIMAAEFSAKGP